MTPSFMIPPICSNTLGDIASNHLLGALELAEIHDDPPARDSLDWAIAGEDINWEGPALYCSHTGYRIESAYAEPEETELAGSEYE